jgi:hypothetical protein
MLSTGLLRLTPSSLKRFPITEESCLDMLPSSGG